MVVYLQIAIAAAIWATIPSPAYCQITSELKFYEVDPIVTNRECKYFQNSMSNIAQVYLYYKEKEFYIDSDRMHKFENCLYSLPDLSINRLLVTIFESSIEGDLGIKMATDYKQLVQKTMDWITLVPQVPVLMGPGGSTVITKPPLGEVPFLQPIIIAVSEKEDINAAYSDEFVQNLNQSLEFPQFAGRYLRLNGWHVKNMRKVLGWPGMSGIAGILIYVESTHSGKINQKDVLAKLDLGTPPKQVMWHIPPSYGSSTQIRIAFLPPFILVTMLFYVIN